MKVLDFLKEIDQVLGIIFFEEKENIPQIVQEVLEKRKEARKNKNYKLADELREYIYDLGYIVEDLSNGERVKKK
jgi:cysteinyl-tRNA synthetase